MQEINMADDRDVFMVGYHDLRTNIFICRTCSRQFDTVIQLAKHNRIYHIPPDFRLVNQKAIPFCGTEMINNQQFYPNNKLFMNNKFVAQEFLKHSKWHK